MTNLVKSNFNIEHKNKQDESNQGLSQIAQWAPRGSIFKRSPIRAV